MARASEGGPRWFRTFAAALSLLGAGAASADPGWVNAPAPPIAWQDTGPFAQMFLQLPFDAPTPIAPGAVEVNVRTLYANSIARQRTAELSVDVSVETAATIAFVRVGLPRGFELQLSLPGAIAYGGFLWRPIKLVERLFDSANPLRTGRPPAAARYRITRADGAGLDWSGATGGVGDPWLGVKRLVRAQDDWQPALAWRAAIAVPAAPLPLGSGRLELGTGVLAAWTFGGTSLLVEADAMIPAGRPITAAELGTRTHYALQLGVLRRFAPWLTGMLQASAHTSAIGGTGLDGVDGTTTYLLAGVGFEPSRSTSIAFALVENVLHPTRGADISAVLELGWRR